MSRSTRTHLRCALAIALALLGLAASAPAAGAVGLDVDSLADTVGGNCSSTTSCTLREALELVAEGEEGEEEIGGDVTIGFDVTGTIEVEDEFELELGEGVESLRIVGPGWEDLAIDGTGQTRVFRVSEGEGTIAGLMVENAFRSGGIADADGGAALLQKGGELTLEEVRFTRNHIEDDRDGGAIDLESGDLTIVDSVIDHNTANGGGVEEGNGGGLNVDDSGSTLTVSGTEVASNESVTGHGGGIFQDEGNLAVDGSVITGNKASGELGYAYGGGIAAEPDGSHTTKIERTTISGNSAEAGGGLLAATGAGGFLVTEATISDNTADAGGGVAIAGPTTIEASTVSGNEAVEFGGGIAISSGFDFPAGSPSLLLETATVAGNAGGGVHIDSGEAQIHASTIAANTNSEAAAGGISGESGEQMSVRSSIVSGNSGNAGAGDCAVAVASGGHNLVGVQQPGCTWSEGEGDLFMTSPLLGPLADNGGPTQTMAPISAASPAINHGADPTRNDQRGLKRPVPIGVANTDIGAVEVQAPVNTVPPVAEAPDGLREGEELICKPGSWDNDTITSGFTYSYAWFVDNSPAGAESTYTLKAADAGKEVACRVAADNGATTSADVESNSLEMQPGALSLSPTEFDFGHRNVFTGPSAAKAFTVKNEGGTSVTVSGAGAGDSQFPVQAADCTNVVLGPGGECTVEVSFSPVVTGLQTTTLSVVSSVPMVNADLEGTGTAGAVSISPSSFDFGPLNVNSGPSSAQVFEVSSSGTGPVTIGAASIEASAEFEIVGEGDGCAGETLEPGEKCTLEIAFDPTTTGGKEGILSVPSDAPTATAELEGTGTLAEILVTPSSFDFGTREIESGPSAAETFTVSSAGNEALVLGAPSVSAEYAIPTGGNECADETLQPGEECTIEVVFDPATVGEHAGNLSVPSNVPTAVASLLGVGVEAPAFAADPSELDFGSHEVGTTTTETVTVSNPGGLPVDVDSVILAGADAASFSLPASSDGCSGAELDPNGTCTVEVSFSPGAAGPAEASLKVEGGAPTLAVPLSGAGTAKPVPPPPPPLPTASLLSGSSVSAGASGAVALSIGCKSASGAPCQVTVALQAGGSPLGDWSGSVAAGASAAAEVPLSAAARKKLGAKSKLAAEAVLSVSGGNGTTVPVTLVAPKAPKLIVKSAKRAGDAIVFKLSCQGYAARCQGKLTLGPAKGSGTYASGKVTLPKGTHELRLPLKASGRRALEADPRAQLLAKLTAKDPVYHRTIDAKAKLRLAGS